MLGSLDNSCKVISQDLPQKLPIRPIEGDKKNDSWGLSLPSLSFRSVDWRQIVALIVLH